MTDLSSHLLAGHHLSAEQIHSAMDGLIAPEIAAEAKAEFLTRLRQKGETAAEIAGFADALLARAVDPALDPARLSGPLLDLCGTGGDRSELFNVSTTSMFVVAAAGAAVVKHGNRAVTSKCGAADVLEELGVPIELSPAELRENMERHGLGFLFAPAYHPAFKAIGPIRKRLAGQGITTIFNILGPLLNPARPERQLVGIFSRELLPRYAEALSLLGRTKAWAVHGHGLDELAITGPNEIHEITATGTRSFTLDPSELGFPLAEIAELRGASRAENAAILLGILSGEIQGPKRDMVVLNSGAALVVAGLASDLPTGFAMAREQIDSGRAMDKLNALRASVA
jgi:anthranilate phosphoribosyltransferase